MRWLFQEHTKRLLDAVLQLPDQELLLQRHFVAALAAVQNWGKGGGQDGSEKAAAGGGASSACGRTFVTLKSLVRAHGVASKSGAGKLSPREVSAALAQAEREGKGGPHQAAAKAHAREQVPKERAVGGESEEFSVAQFLVGCPVGVESGASEGGRGPQARSAGAAVSLEELVGLSPSSGPPRVSAKAVRHLAEMLVENRFRWCILCLPRCMWTTWYESEGGSEGWAGEGTWALVEREAWTGCSRSW